MVLCPLLRVSPKSSDLRKEVLERALQAKRDGFRLGGSGERRLGGPSCHPYKNARGLSCDRQKLARARARLADEYDAAKDRGEVAGEGRPKTSEDAASLPSAEDLGIDPRLISEGQRERYARARRRRAPPRAPTS